ncbi:unnamed protein product [Porites lobata]|uniref:Carboxylesterase type B domain-containing protein n=1 Tax=Porites lobata TaxID=104759 RepID=A0ABN8P0Q5_9CNID|nr:unnamed protein product [Porites lobata]
MVNNSFGLMESLDNGVSPTFFQIIFKQVTCQLTLNMTKFWGVPNMVWYRIENIWQCCLGRYLIVSTFCSICDLYSVVTTILFCKTIIGQKEATLKHLAIKNCEKNTGSKRMTKAYSKISGYDRAHVYVIVSDKKNFHSGERFQKFPDTAGKICWIHVDASRIRKKKFATAFLRKLFDIGFSYKHCNFSRVCLLVKMASKTVTRSSAARPFFLVPTTSKRLLRSLCHYMACFCSLKCTVGKSKVLRLAHPIRQWKFDNLTGPLELHVLGPADRSFRRKKQLHKKKCLKMLLATFFIFCACWLHVRAEIVSTKYGDIEGLVTLYPNASGPFKSVSKFLGVPFSAPPTGELRFKAPQPPREWKPKVYSAKTHGSVCLQFKLSENVIKPFTSNFTFSEDCLYLDIYSPNISLSLPVMVYIHGGGYVLGTAITSPSDILALHGVVVVIIQYRLGPFGFLTTGDSAAPGNYGMLDQVEALKWIKENIENFGGNPSKVTIFGQSAGGSSVGLHLLSPLSRDLFHQAIPESGVDLSPFAIQPTSFGLRFTKELAQKLNCGSSDHYAMVSCMRSKTASDMQKAAESIKFGFVNYLYWAPVVDKNFLHDTPQVLRKKGEFKQVPLVITFTSNEGATFLGDMVNNSLGLMENVDNGVSPTLFKSFLIKKKNADLLADALEFMYTPWPDNSNKYALRSQLVDLIGDNLYFAPSHKVADVHSQVAPVYMYEFAHRAKTSMGADWMGVVHSENVPFDFGVPLLPKFLSLYSPADRNVSLLIMTMYANFARSGDPSVSGVAWEKYNSSHRAYLKVDTSPKLKTSFNSRRMSFWNNYYPKLEQVKFDVNKEVVSGAKDVVTMGTALQVVFALIKECSKMQLATFFLFSACWLHVRAETVSTKYGDIEGLVTSYPNASGRRSNLSANFLAFLSPLHQLES